MRKQVVCCAGIVLLILSASAAAQFGRWQREAREFGWLTDYQTAKDEAKKANKPIMLVFRCVP